jgi:GTP pyrophosphokinase
VLDLAFAIHSELGLHCIAGKINHRLVPLSYILGSGDQVEIITSSSQVPQADWLQYCHTAKAQNRVRAVLRKDKKNIVARGEQLFNEFMKKEGVTPSNEIVTKILGYYHLDSREALYAMLANDEINISAKELKEINKSRSSLLSKILRKPFSSKKKTESAEHPKINRKEVYILRPDDAKPNYMLDTCCAPIPGDDVLGFIDDDENVIVHKVNCPTAMRLKSSFGSRLVATRWEGKADAFMATIGVDGIDRHGILEAITKVVSQDLGINIRGLNIAAKQEVFHCELSVMIDTTETVDNICAELKKIDNVKFAKRIS